MRGIKFLILVAIIIAMSVVVGCGGKSGRGQLRGVANIHSSASSPCVGILYTYGSTFLAASSASMSRSSSGWRDVNFSVSVPDDPGYSKVYAVGAFNDTDGDKQYKTSELLGFSNCFLRWNESAGKWQIIDVYGNILHSDALAGSGRDNIFIDATFERSTRTNEEKELAIKEAINKVKIQ